jgi:TonB family protein
LLTLFLLLTAQPAEATAMPAPVAIDPVGWFSPSDYPAAAMRRGSEGKVMYRVEVGPDGRATACEIAAGTADEDLNKVTCDLVLARARFQPARDAEGRPLPSQYKGGVSWKIPHGDNGPVAFRRATIEIAADGTPSACRVLAKVMLAEAEQTCAHFLADTAIFRQLAPRYRQVTFEYLSRESDAPEPSVDQSPGERLARIANRQVYLGGSYPVACENVAAEGFSQGIDPCEGFPNNRSLTAEEKTKATFRISEQSLFAVPRD